MHIGFGAEFVKRKEMRQADEKYMAGKACSSSLHRSLISFIFIGEQVLFGLRLFEELFQSDDEFAFCEELCMQQLRVGRSRYC